MRIAERFLISDFLRLLETLELSVNFPDAYSLSIIGGKFILFITLSTFGAVFRWVAIQAERKTATIQFPQESIN